MIYKDEQQATQALNSAYAQIKEGIAKVIVGQDRVVELMLTALMTRGHALLVGVPGLAKTMLVKTLADCLNLVFNRIQFTPDLMPSDITGTEILEEEMSSRKRFFKFIKGPIFCNILLADEINRTPPKTQAALLQAMQEGFVTASGTQHDLNPPFLVFATQNPIEQEGTYPLPEAQLDRFMFFISVDYPSVNEEEEIVVRQTSPVRPEIKPVLSIEEILALQQLMEKVPVPDHIVSYTVRLVRASRPQEKEADDFIKKMVRWGAGPRASQYLVASGKARAVINGRTAVDINDIKALAEPILRHRIIPNFQAEADGIGSIDIVKHLVEQIEY
jgi:MoxR-like ATPase